MKLNIYNLLCYSCKALKPMFKVKDAKNICVFKYA